MGWSDSYKFRDCPWCGLRDAQMNLAAGNMEAKGQPGVQRTWSVVSCPRCAGVVLIETTSIREGSKILSTFPQDSKAGQVIKYLPEEVEKHYLNAIRAIDAGLPDAAAVQLRKTLEAAADKYGALKSNLANSIKELITQGLITPQFSKVLDRVRKVGNLGAHHTDEEIDPETANQVFRFTTQVLRNLFEIPGELNDLEKESGSESSPTTQQD